MQCPGQFDTLRSTSACVVPTLHAVKVAYLVFYNQNTTFTVFFLYNPLYWGPDRPDSIFSYLFLCCDVSATLPVHYFQRLPTFPCLQTSWTSVNGTKVYVTVQYIYIVTRGSDLMFIGVIYLILSLSRHTTFAFNSFWSIFRYNGGFSSYTINVAYAKTGTATGNLHKCSLC